MDVLFSVRPARLTAGIVRVQPYRRVKSKAPLQTYQDVIMRPKAGGKVFTNQNVNTYDIIRSRLSTPLGANAIHHHPFHGLGWWTVDDIVDHGVGQYDLDRFKFEPLVKRVLAGRVVKNDILHVNGYFHLNG